MFTLKKEIEDFANSELKESVVLAIMKGKNFKELIDKYKTTRSNANLIKKNFLEYIYEHKKEYFDNYLNNLKFEKTMKLEKNKYINITKEVLSKFFRNDALYGEDIVILSSFHLDVMNYIAKSDIMPISIDEIAENLNCSTENILDVLKFNSINHPIYFDEEYIYSFKAGAYVLVDIIASQADADLPELYLKISKIIKELPKPIATYEKFVALVNTKMVVRKTSNAGLENFLRIGKGKEGIVTRKRALRLYGLNEKITNKIIAKSVEIAKKVECGTDSEYILSKLKEHMDLHKDFNSYVLKSILVQSDVFEQGRKFNLALKDANCHFKTLDQYIEMAFEKTGKDKMTAKEIHELIVESGKSVSYSNLYLTLKRHFVLEKIDNKTTSVFSKERIGVKKE